MTASATELIVYVPGWDHSRALGQRGRSPIPLGAGIIGVRFGGELDLYFQARGGVNETWADHLHVAARRHLDDEPPTITVPAMLMQRVAAYDPRDGTATIDSWNARRLVRTWLGGGRRDLIEEAYTTVVPEHTGPRVVLHTVRSGYVPPSVRAYAERHGHDELIEQPPPQPALTPDGEATGPVYLTRTQIEAIAAAAADDREVAGVEVDNVAPNTTTYRVHYADGGVTEWRHAAESRVPDAPHAPPTEQRPQMKRPPRLYVRDR